MLFSLGTQYLLKYFSVFVVFWNFSHVTQLLQSLSQIPLNPHDLATKEVIPGIWGSLQPYFLIWLDYDFWF